MDIPELTDTYDILFPQIAKDSEGEEKPEDTSDIISELTLFCPSDIGLYVRDGVTDQELILRLLTSSSLRSMRSSMPMQVAYTGPIYLAERLNNPNPPPSDSIGIYIKGEIASGPTGLTIKFTEYSSTQQTPINTTETFPLFKLLHIKFLTDLTLRISTIPIRRIR